MEFKDRLLLSMVGCVFLSGCSTPPPLPKTTIVDTRVFNTANGSKVTILTQNAINGNVLEDTDNSLNIVSKADNAKVVGLKVLQVAAALLGGGGGVNGHSKEQLKGNYITSVKNETMEYLNPELDATISKINIPAEKENKITVKPYKFKLVYDGLDNDNYEFKYSVIISVGDFYHICSSHDLISTERIQPIELWEKNNYELTQVIAKKIIKNCFESINSGENRVKLTNALLSSDDKNNP